MTPYGELMKDLACKGWCGSSKEGVPVHVDFLLPDRGTITSKRFAELVIIAEHEDPYSEESKNRQSLDLIKSLFEKYMGSTEVSVENLKYL